MNNVTKSLKILFCDIEISPQLTYTWPHTGKQYITYEQILEDSKIIMISYKWAGKKKVYNITWDEEQNDKCVVDAFQYDTQAADVIIGHNSQNFDLKHIQARLCDHNLNPLNIKMPEDTYRMVKKKFALPSYKLDYLVKRYGLGSKLHLGGWDSWKAVCWNDDRKMLEKMVKYCNMDVLLSEKLYWRVYGYVDHPFNLAVINENKEICPKCASKDVIKRGFNHTKAAKRQILQCNNCYRYSVVGANLIEDSSEYPR